MKIKHTLAMLQRLMTRGAGAVLFLCVSSLHAFSQAPGWQWAKSIGGSTYDAINEVACDQVGHIYSTGFFLGTVDFDPGPGVFNLTSNGGAFVSKLDATGNLVWAKSFNGITTNDYAENFAIALNENGSGEVYTTGYFSGAVDFDPGAGIFTLTAANFNIDIFVCKLDSSGNFIWAKAFQNVFSSTVSYGITLALDPSGNGDVYTAGNFTGVVDFDPGTGSYNMSASGINFTDIFISKLNGSGNFVWAKKLGGPDNDLVRCILADPVSGRLYTTGYFAATADFDPAVGSVMNITAAGDWDAFLCSMDTSGNLVWAEAISGVGRDLGMSMAMDPFGSGSIFTTGSFNGTTDFDPDSSVVFNMTSNSYDFFILKLDSSGNFIWVKKMGGAGNDEAFCIKMDPTGSGDIYTTGFFEMTCDFDPDTATYNLTEAGGGDVFISKLDSAGNFAWARAMGGTDSDYGDGLAINSSGQVFLSGMFESSSIAFGSTILVNTFAGNDDIFIAKLDTGLATGLEHVLTISGISMYPNPVIHELTIRNDQPDGITKLEIYNVTGKKLIEKTGGKASREEKLDLSQLAAGIYFLKVVTGTREVTLKVVRAGNK